MTSTKKTWVNRFGSIITLEPNDPTGMNGLQVAKTMKTYRHGDRTLPLKEWEANAKLIAAAPELYQVLNDLVLNIHMSAKTLQPHVERAHKILRSAK